MWAASCCRILVNWRIFFDIYLKGADCRFKGTIILGASCKSTLHRLAFPNSSFLSASYPRTRNKEINKIRGQNQIMVRLSKTWVHASSGLNSPHRFVFFSLFFAHTHYMKRWDSNPICLCSKHSVWKSQPLSQRVVLRSPSAPLSHQHKSAWRSKVWGLPPGAQGSCVAVLHQLLCRASHIQWQCRIDMSMVPEVL